MFYSSYSDNNFDTLFKNIEYINSGFLGISVYDINTNSELYSYNSEKLFVPASNTKILTLLSSIVFLEDSIIGYYLKEKKDSIIIWGCGDFVLFNKDFNDISKNPFSFYKNTNKKIVLSTGNFKDNNYGYGWMWDDLMYSFTPYKYPYSFYGNKIYINVNDNKKDSITSYPSEIKKYIVFDTTKKKNYKRNFYSNDITINKNKLSKNLEFSMVFRKNYFLNILKDSFNIDAEFNNKILYDSVVKPFYTIKKDTALKKMMKDSDNFISEQLLYSIGCRNKLNLNTYKIINFLKDSLFKTIDSIKNIKMVDASGISRYNLLSPKFISNTLIDLDKRLKNRTLLKEYFSIGGVDGTLKNMFKTRVKPYFFGKSGSMSGVYNLSGYLISNKGNFLAVSIMNNNFSSSNFIISKECEKIINLIREKY